MYSTKGQGGLRGCSNLRGCTQLSKKEAVTARNVLDPSRGVV